MCISTVLFTLISTESIKSNNIIVNKYSDSSIKLFTPDFCRLSIRFFAVFTARNKAIGALTLLQFVRFEREGTFVLELLEHICFPVICFKSEA